MVLIMRRLIFISLLLATLASLSACSVLKASPAPDTGFLPNPERLSEMRERAPFHASWFLMDGRYAALKENYTKIHVRPIETGYLRDQYRKADLPDGYRTQRIEELTEVARFLEGSLKLSLEQYPDAKLEVVDQPGPGVFVLELARAELTPTDPTINTIGTAAGFFVPGGGLIKRVGQGSIAIEGIVRDGETGEVLEQFRDREADKSSAFSVKDFQQYAHARESIVDWAEQLAELANTPLDHKVEDSLPFSLSVL